ncbi:MAG: CPBP family intramembrane metalloprotease [Firmicutes bacterium]|nr:CPBP family intramembrane metalloprotease [Bacillota bacterium]
MKRFLRPSGRWTDILPIAIFASLVFLFIGSMLGALILNPPEVTGLVYKLCGDDDVAAFMMQYLDFVGIWVAMFLYILFSKANRPMIKALGYDRKGNTPKGFLLGLLFGFGCNGICVLLSWIMGDIKLSFVGFDPKLLLLFFIAITIQSGAEEITDRLYLYQKLRRRYKSPLIAIITNSAVFMALHVFNPGFTAIAGVQIFIIGVIFSMLVYYYNSLWCAIAFHMAWNFTQNIIFGLPNSGIVSAYSIFKLEAASARNGLFYNVNFGVEGSVGASVILLIFGAVLYMKSRDRGECCDLWEDASPQETPKAL